MHFLSRIILIGLGIGLGLGSFVVFAEAGTYQTTLAECQKRTGLSASLCKGLIKNNLTVESCKKQTGLSDDECAKRIEEIRNDPEFAGTATPVNTPPRTNMSSDPIAQPMSTDESGVGGLRVKKERQLVELQSKTRTLMNFLKERGADVSVAEKNFGEFEKKSQELLFAYEAFQATYIDTMNDSTATKEAIRDEARGMVTRSRTILLEYYRTNIFNPLRTAYQQVS